MSHAVDQTVLEHQVRDALLHLHDPGHLQRHPLGLLVPLDPPARASSAGPTLRRSLLDAIESLRPSPKVSPVSLVGRTYRILMLRYVENLEASQVMDRLGLSKTAYYVGQQRAIAEVTSVLVDTWGLRDGSEPLPAVGPPAKRGAGDQGASAGRPTERSGQLAAQEPIATNLPVSLTSFVGREREMAEVTRLLTTTRLLTLTGAGGCGKTRLAVEAARSRLAAYPDGVWFVSLAALADPALVPQTVAAALGVREAVGVPILSTVVRHLEPRTALLLLDNCEHLLDATASMTETLLEACPALSVVATSRQALGIAGEVTFRVPSLASPVPEERVSGEALVQAVRSYDACRLFVDRAMSALPSFALTRSNASAVAEICRQLDGIPLAIELAAARVRVLPPDQIASRLDRDFHLLTSGSRTALPRQQTLKATLDWSHDLLSEQERVLLRRLSVFAGGFTLEAAESICQGGEIGGLEVIDLLLQLVEKSLVEVHPGDGDARYRLLEPVRQYAWHHLEEAGETDVLQRRHVDWLVDYVLMRGEDNYGRTEVQWLERVARERDNVRAALLWCLDHDPESGMELSGRVIRYWQFTGEDAERDRWLHEFLGRSTRRIHERGSAFLFLGIEARDRGNTTLAMELLGERLAIDRELGDEVEASIALCHLGVTSSMRGEQDRAAALLDEAVAAAERGGSELRVACARLTLAIFLTLVGDHQQARALAEEALCYFRGAGAVHGIANSLLPLGGVAYSEGDYPRARACLEESIATSHVIDDGPTLGMAHTSLGYVDILEGRYAQARAHLQEALRLLKPFGHRPRMSRALVFLGVLAIREGDLSRGVRLVGSAEAVHPLYRFMLAPNEASDLDACLAGARQALGEAGYARAWAEGQAMIRTGSVEYASLGDA